MAEEQTFRGSVLKIGADGTSLPRSVFTTNTRLCVALPGGGITRTVFIEKIESISLSLAPAATANHADVSSRNGEQTNSARSSTNQRADTTHTANRHDGKNDGGASESPVVFVALRVTKEPVLALRLASEEEALALVGALKQSPYCDASFHTPNWTYVSPTRRQGHTDSENGEEDEEEEEGNLGAAAEVSEGRGRDDGQEKRGPSVASTQEGHRESKSPVAPSPPSPLSSSTSTAPGDSGAVYAHAPAMNAAAPAPHDMEWRPPQPARALAGESSFAVHSEDAPDIDRRDAGAAPTAPLAASPLEDMVGDARSRPAAPSMRRASVEQENTIPSRNDPQATLRSVVAAADASPRSTSVHAWVPPKQPNFWGTRSDATHSPSPYPSSRPAGSGDLVTSPTPFHRDVEAAASRPRALVSHEPQRSSQPPSQRRAQEGGQEGTTDKDQTIAELRRALRMHEDLLQQLMVAQEAARTAKAAEAEATREAAHYRQSLEATELQLDRVSRSFTEVLQRREEELQQEHRSELNAIQDAFEAYDKRMNAFVDQLQRDFQEEKRQWRQERQVLQTLLDKQNLHLDSVLSVSTPHGATRYTDPSPLHTAPPPSTANPSRPDYHSYDDARQRVEARLRTYAENRQRQKQQQQQQQQRAQPAAGETVAGSVQTPPSRGFRRAIRTPSPTKL